ncbi:MAG: hypothetical protein AAB592_05735 [Patescibacteria group bacterium]
MSSKKLAQLAHRIVAGPLQSTKRISIFKSVLFRRAEFRMRHYRLNGRKLVMA